MEQIQIKSLTLSLNREIQTTPQGRQIRYSGLQHQGNEWHYLFNFIGTNDFIIFIFVNDNYISYIC
jgi:hypothetical protein